MTYNTYFLYLTDLRISDPFYAGSRFFDEHRRFSIFHKVPHTFVYRNLRFLRGVARGVAKCVMTDMAKGVTRGVNRGMAMGMTKCVTRGVARSVMRSMTRVETLGVIMDIIRGVVGAW